MKFSKTLETLENGGMIKRQAWNKQTFVFMQVPSVIPIETIPKMQSLPLSVKNEFVRRAKDEIEMVEATAHILKTPAVTQHQSISYHNQLAIVLNDNTISSYSPSVADVLADDWTII